MLRRRGRKRAPDPDRHQHNDDDFNAEFWSRGPDDPPPGMSPRLETPPGARLYRPRPPWASHDESDQGEEVGQADGAAVDHERDEAAREEARLAELDDRTRADLSRIATRFGNAGYAAREEAVERHEAKLAKLADATKAELSRIAAQFERAIDARREDAERHEAKLAELADATRAELSRVAARFERVAADRIARVEEMSVRAAAQADEISKRMAALDQREAEFTRRLEEGLEHLDSELSAWRNELTRLREERDAALDRAAAKQVTDRVTRVDEHRGSFGDAIAQRIEELENAVVKQRQETDRRRRPEFERRAVEGQDELARARSARANEIHWTRAE